MCLLFESIRVENRQFDNLHLHISRMNDAVLHYFGQDRLFSEADFIIPPGLTPERYKCRVMYGKTIKSIEFQLYTKRILQKIKLAYCDDVEYSYKLIDRSFFDNLFVQYPGYDDFLIIKKGSLTDTTFSNIALFNGNEWHTPKSCLLKGTRRKLLLDTNIIREKEINVQDLSKYHKISLINAMLDLGESVIDIHNIVF